MAEGPALMALIAGVGGTVTISLWLLAVRLGWIDEDVCVCCGEDDDDDSR